MFLARRSYRRRRLADAARALPVLGAFLFVLPALGAGRGPSTTLAVLFIAWAALILAARLMAPRLLDDPAEGEAAPRRDPDR